MDNGKGEFTSLTLVEEDLFETGESTDGESEDLDELIFKAENSQHLWLNCDELTTDVGLLQERLRQKDEGLHLTAKIGKKLLINTNRLTNQNQELKAQVLDLKEELTQLRYLQSSRGKSFQYFEASDDDEDEGTCCRNHSLSPHSNASNNSQVSLSVSPEETFSLRRQIEQLQLNNFSLRDELKALQQEALDEVDQLKEHYSNEFLNTKKLIGNLEKKIEMGENRFSKFEYETKVWKDSVEALATRCNLHECEIDELQSEISKIKLDQKEEKKAMQQLVRENEELKELVADLKGRVHQMEQNNQPKVLRHVTDSSSPYVDSKSFTQELEHGRIEGSKENRIIKAGPTTTATALPHFIGHLVYQPESFFARMRDMFTRNVTLKLGQPGRPGSGDLELALSGFSLTGPLFNPGDPFFATKSSVSWIGYQMQLLEAFLGAEKHCSKVKSSLGEKHKKQVTDGKDGMILAKINQSSSSLCKAHDLQHSKFVKNWCNLGTPDLTTIFRKQSGVWIKGSAVGEVFIEENFADIGLEAEEDDAVQTTRISSSADSANAGKYVNSEQVLPKSKICFKVKAYISAHKSLDDIAKCSYEGILPPFKSISLNDMSLRLNRKHAKTSLGLDCLCKNDSRHFGEFDFGDDFFSSMKIVRSSSSD